MIKIITMTTIIITMTIIIIMMIIIITTIMTIVLKAIFPRWYSSLSLTRFPRLDLFHRVQVLGDQTEVPLMQGVSQSVTAGR